MSAARIAALTLVALLAGWTSYLSYYGVGGESRDVSQSVRERSAGGGGFSGRVK